MDLRAERENFVVTPLKRYIREGRMGPPLTYKTGAVVNTYPKPMLVFEFDTGGLDVVTHPLVKIEMDRSGIRGLDDLCKTPREKLPPITVLDFSTLSSTNLLNADYTKADSIPLILFTDCVNKLIVNGCPWKTVVVDPITGLTGAIVMHIGGTQPQAMNDARRWAFMAGDKVQQIIGVVQGLPCHTVFIMHCEEDENELTKEIRTFPMIPSKLKQRIGGLFSQFFYAVLEKGEPPKPFVLTQPEGFVKGIGARYPNNMKAKCGATFQEIYGSEDKI